MSAELIRTILGYCIMLSAIGLLAAIPLNHDYKYRKKYGKLDPNKSFLENYFFPPLD
ncbi:MAG: hypothetical protein MK033_12985 [Candidatus Caenarcaniphilales bacterium]|nr:hypothetical protein [Candidatus Caenarcaniphilales bacterium]